MALPKPVQRRRARRFQIDCPITVSVLSPRNGGRMMRGQLRDIGVCRARFHLSYPLAAGAGILFHVHFPHPEEEVTTVRFEGIVTRVHDEFAQEFAVQFQRGARFLRGNLANLFRPRKSKENC